MYCDTWVVSAMQIERAKCIPQQRHRGRGRRWLHIKGV